ncbi:MULTISPECIES: hypothetical protein [unclassified Methanothrix]|uniref:hypothetical protein n=1 Tax=unclassified Methanothrix TaxID=2620051 RepID=UPI00257E9B4F|nr:MULTISPECIES: hypothetical protein [unclassified Methanothrix]HRW32440.1 hypothetical protein [Methanothrix sp.]
MKGSNRICRHVIYSIAISLPITPSEPLPPLPDIPRGSLLIVQRCHLALWHGTAQIAHLARSSNLFLRSASQDGTHSQE